MLADLTQAIQDITNIKPRQKNLAKKVMKKREITPKDVMDSGQDEKAGEATEDQKRGLAVQEEGGEGANRVEQSPLFTGVSPQDVPDGAQISKAFDTLCNIVRDRMRKYKSKPEPIADFYTKGRYVLVTGDGSYLHPCFYSSSPSAGHVFVTIRDNMMSPYDPYSPFPTPPQPMPMPMPMPMPGPGQLDPTLPSDGESGKGGRGKGKHRNGDPHSRPKDPGPTPQPNPAPGPGPRGGKDDDGRRGHPSMPSPLSTSSMPPDSMSYEKVELVESVEKFSDDNKVKGYEQTAMVVETMIEKTSKKKH